jgi:hypothetical protein
LNCRNVGNNGKFDVGGTVVPNSVTASAPVIEIKMATFTGAEHAHYVFWFEETRSATQVQREFRTQYHKEHFSMSIIYS